MLGGRDIPVHESRRAGTKTRMTLTNKTASTRARIKTSMAADLGAG
jgi:hypothetical protein